VPTLAEIIAALDSWYPPETAASWDSVGLTCGDPGDAIGKVLLAVDCVPDTVTEARAVGAQLLFTHHPLLLTGVHGVPASNPKGSMVHQMISRGIAHFAAHTNADVAERGVSSALAERLNLIGVGPLDPDAVAPIDQLSVFVPEPDLDRLISALSDAGAGTLGHYDQCTFVVAGSGTFRPLPGANPSVGEIGVVNRVVEVRLSMALPRHRREAVIAAMRAAHPYEQVAFELTEQARLNARTGTGRIGELPEPMTLRTFLDYAAARLPPTVWGLRAAGDPGRAVQRVAVCGGSGAEYADLARSAGADTYLTSDLKHHSTLEAVSERQSAGAPPVMALVDVAHWATEAPWLSVVAAMLRSRFGPGLDVRISQIVTDPWTLHAEQRAPGQSHRG